jgi:LAO/AO transport system kinase
MRNLEATLHMGLSEKQDGWMPRVLPTVAAGHRAGEVQGIGELVEAILEHQAYLHESRAIDQVRAKRVEQELGLIFKDEMEKIVFAGLKGTGRKREFIEAIIAGRNDPYSVVDEILREFLIGANSTERL